MSVFDGRASATVVLRVCRVLSVSLGVSSGRGVLALFCMSLAAMSVISACVGLNLNFLCLPYVALHYQDACANARHCVDCAGHML